MCYHVYIFIGSKQPQNPQKIKPFKLNTQTVCFAIKAKSISNIHGRQVLYDETQKQQFQSAIVTLRNHII